MFKRILVPLDEAARAERSIPVAARLARASNGSVILLQVVAPPIDYGGYLTQAPLLSESMIETYLDGSPLAETALEPAAYLIAALASPSGGALHLALVCRD